MDKSSSAPPPARVKTSRWPQYAATAVVALLGISYSLSSLIRIDMFKNSPSWPILEGLDDMMLSSSIAAILSFPVFAFLFEKFNRKICVYIISAICFATCILHKTANSLFWFHVAYPLFAIGHTGFTFISTIYVSEIAEDDIRGSLLVLVYLLNYAFFVPLALFEIYVSRISFSWIVIVPPVAVTLCFAFWLPETPVYFLRRGNRDAATRSLLWLRRGGTTESLAQDVDDLEKVLKATRSDVTNSSSVFRELFNRRTLKYSGIVLVLQLVRQFSGHAGIVWITLKLKNTARGENMYYIVSSLLLTSIVAGYFTAFLLCDRIGRRTLLLISAVVCSICLFLIAICTYTMTYNNEISAANVFAIIFTTTFIFSMGLRTEIVVLADMFPPKILVIQLVIMGILSYSLNIVVENNKYIHSFITNAPPPGLLWAHCAVCGAGALFIFKYLPETKKQPAGFLFIEDTKDVHLRKM